MKPEILLSILMPCYNVSDTLSRALDSILMQRVDFSYEIIIVDDCSTDNTVDITLEYAAKYEQIRLIQRAENGGNAPTYYDGLCAAQGDFFCVLDGDDYYTHREKLQRQIDFFRNDIFQEYVATAHYHLNDLCNGNINIEMRRAASNYNYVDFLTMKMGYFHTSTYMYRNIFKGNVPALFKEDRFRGDVCRTAFHLQTSRKKVKVLNFVGSAYVKTGNGIWTGMDTENQKKRNVLLFTSLRDIASTTLEKTCYDIKLESFENDRPLFGRTFPIRIDYSLNRLKKYTEHFFKDYIFENCYYSQYVDSLCASLGYVNRIHHPECLQTKVHKNRIAIVIGILSPRGGGIFREITELIKIYADKEIMLFVTNMSNERLPQEALDILGEYPNVSIKAAPSDQPEKLVWYGRVMADFAPVKAYYYTSHNDTYAQALMQNGLCKNICLFSFDHGYLCGISNPNLDVVIAKRPLDYTMLRKQLGEKVIYVPTWGNQPNICDAPRYQPFQNHSRLITATAAARYYKVSGKPPDLLLELVPELLRELGGIHYHFGPIPQDKLDCIYDQLREYNVSTDAFVNIEWTDNMAKDMLVNNIDVFIESYPVVSYKITLEMLAAGIPVVAHRSMKRMETIDFIYPNSILWEDKHDIIKILSSLTPQQLSEHSRLSTEYFAATHAIDTVRPYILDDKPFPCAEESEAVDGVLLEVRPYESTFGMNNELNLHNELNIAYNALSREAEAVQIGILKKSNIYRYGFAAIFPFRALRTFLSITKSFGIKKAIQTARSPGLLSDKHLDPLGYTNRISGSNTWRLGLLLTYPYRKLMRKPGPLVEDIISVKMESVEESQYAIWEKTFECIGSSSQYQAAAEHFIQGRDISYLELYVIYRALQYVQPKHILHIGTTSGMMLIDAYLDRAKRAKCILVDKDESVLSGYQSAKKITVATSLQQNTFAHEKSFELLVVHVTDNTVISEIMPLLDNLSNEYAIVLSGTEQKPFLDAAHMISDTLEENGSHRHEKSFVALGYNIKIWFTAQYAALYGL